MRFLKLIRGAAGAGVGAVANAFEPQADPEIYGIDYDSRRVRPGFLFVAMRGETSDGNRFIDSAITNGAVAVVSDSESLPREGIAWARVEHGRRALASLSARFYSSPADRLHITGITGTNGKTTTAFLLESILNAAGRSTILIGTIEYHVAGEVYGAPHTTPEPLDLQRLFAGGVHRGAAEAVMEVSSHALAQERTYGLAFDVAVFTNLTQDHLDYHRDFESYFAAKRRLFEGVGAPPPRAAAINAEDEYGRRLLAAQIDPQQRIAYGVGAGEVRASALDLGRDGVRFRLDTPAGTVQMESLLLGRVNVQNILAATAAALARGCQLDEISEGVRRLQRVPGRFERV
ncbi:MAG: UDP-N-acetylmuramoyl-L-alanyl-D-glutamate--2,6-diaminopimelate ligase, partial [Acidobacteria bacterium]|nr:UDP-N-acetylmuramoyl-L-alanyl-D-glutamate--2,6-diaminopimelate ligase [Acidobacteriota bacterium]